MLRSESSAQCLYYWYYLLTLSLPLYQVMTTAIASVLMLGRRLSGIQWVSLAILTLGMVVMQLPGSREAGRGDATGDPAGAERVVPRSSMSGAWAMLLSTVLSACAHTQGVWTIRPHTSRQP